MTIERYVELIEGELPFARRMRKRIGAEVADYLHESTERKRDRGLCIEDAQKEACESFGPPDEVARRFAESRGVLGVATTFTRWTGLAALIGVVLVMGSFVGQEIGGWEMVWPDVAGGTGGVLMVLGLVGMHMRQRGRYGAIGRWGFRAVLAGFAVSLVSALLWFTPGGIAGMITVAAGVVAIAVATWRAGVLPKLPIALLAAGVVLAFGANAMHELESATLDHHVADGISAAGLTVLTAAWAWLGYHLWSEKVDEAAPGSPPEAVV